MNNQLKKAFDSAGKYLFTFVRWIIIAMITGISGGLVGTAFEKSVEFATVFRETHSYIIYFLPIGGLIITLMYKLFKLENTGTNQIISSIRSSEKVPAALAPLIFISTVITHLGGGSAGREGAALQIGGTIGWHLGRLFRLSEKDVHLITMCGMSAVFSALFGTPITAALFAMGVVSIGIMHYSGLVPCIVSSLTAFSTAGLLGVKPVRFTINKIPDLSLKVTLQSVVIGIFCALVSILFCFVIHNCEKMLEKYTKNKFIVTALGGVIIILLGTLLKTNDYYGAGTNIIANAITEATAKPEAFILKLVFTVITICAGFKGGEIVPTFYIGSTLGCTIAKLIGLNPGFGAAIGLVSMFCGVVNCPVASIILAVEMFSTSEIIPFAVACAVSYMLSGYYGLYNSQKIMYSKLTAEFINITAR